METEDEAKKKFVSSSLVPENHTSISKETSDNVMRKDVGSEKTSVSKAQGAKELAHTPDIFNPKLTPPRKGDFKVYRRPQRKKKEDDNIFGIGEGYSAKTSAWKQDERTLQIMGRLLSGKAIVGENCQEFMFSGAKLERAEMTSCSFKGADMLMCNMMHGNFNHSDFTEANLTGANLAGADLSYCDFTNANVGGANFSGANLTGAKFDAVILSEDTDFGGVVADAIVQKNIDKFTLLQEAAENGELDLRTLGIVDLRKLDLRSVNLRGVFLKDRDLKGRLTGVNLSGAMINESDILGADVNMLHYFMQNTNEYNELVDKKAASRYENEMETYAQQNKEIIAEEQELARLQYLQEKLSAAELEEQDMPQRIINEVGDNQTNEHKKGKIVKKARARITTNKSKLIE